MGRYDLKQDPWREDGTIRMVRQVIDVDGKWTVVVWYDVDEKYWNIIKKELMALGTSRLNLEALYRDIRRDKVKAVTCSNIEMRRSVVLFNKHKDKTDYINSIVHEAEHVKQAMLEGYRVMDSGEPPAYTIGYLVGEMWRIWSKI